MEKIKLALADDHTLLRKAMVTMLNSYTDFQVIADAENGKELLETLRFIEPPVDVCLLDVNMPEMNGYETLLALRERFPAIRVLVVTQLDDEYLVVKMLKAGAKGFILKSSEPAELRKGILQVFKDEFFANGQVTKSRTHEIEDDKPIKERTFTDKEQELLKWCCYDMEYKEIAEKMGITNSAIIFYRKQLFLKLGVNSKTALALYGLKYGLVSIDELGDRVKKTRKKL
ncbi:MAG: response regulator transcription factor [Chitinophagaceae bacterium]